eukprot:1655313-Prorocentrum_lima.AAC.1
MSGGMHASGTNWMLLAGQALPFGHTGHICEIMRAMGACWSSVVPAPPFACGRWYTMQKKP